ncbi:50S ribosomal protein L10 [Patescibacteria group bacterium]
MAITRKQKEEIVKVLTDNFDNTSSVTFVDYTGLAVADFDELRSKLRETQAAMLIAKNTLIKLALSKSKRKELKIDDMTGQMAVVFAGGDEVAPAKVVYEFAKQKKKPEIVKGILDMDLLEKEKVIELAKLPSKPEMLGKVVGTIAAPVTGFVNVLSGNLRGLVNVLNSIKDAKA